MLPESRQGGITPHSKAGLNVDPRFDTFCTVKLHWSEFGGNMSGVSTQSPPSTNCNLIDFSLPGCLFSSMPTDCRCDFPLLTRGPGGGVCATPFLLQKQNSFVDLLPMGHLHMQMTPFHGALFTVNKRDHGVGGGRTNYLGPLSYV